MDYLKNLTSGSSEKQAQPQQQNKESGGIMDSVNSALGGGKQSEQKEDYLDKAVDFAQENLGQGPQDNESALEQAKDEQVSDFIRKQYRGSTGKEFPAADK